MDITDMLKGLNEDSDIDKALKDAKINEQTLDANKMIDIQKTISYLPRDKIMEINLYIAYHYCDGTTESYNKWNTIVAKCLKSDEIPQDVKADLSTTD